MSLVKSEDRYQTSALGRCSQGDILRDIELIEWVRIKEGEPPEIDVQRRQFSYVVILSQECDLHQDQQNRANGAKQTQDKYLHSLLLVPAYPAQSVRSGTHLSALGLKCEVLNRERWNVVMQNKNDRYHFMPAFDSLQIPDVVLDFKHFITAPRDVVWSLRESKYLATLGQLFRESLSQRFAHFLARIALPDMEDDGPTAPQAKASAGA